jgi:uncharacterized integral membrane protein
MSFRITWKVHLKCVLMSLIFIIFYSNNTNRIIENFFENTFIFYPTKYLIINFYLYVILLMVTITIVHEVTHGYIYTVFGGKVKYGFKGIYAYTEKASEKSIGRIQFLVVLLSPMVIISLLSLLLPIEIGGMVFILNALGSCGDLYMAIVLSKFDSHCRIIDRNYGFDVIQ